MESLFTGMQYIIDGFGYLMGFPVQEKKRRKIKLPPYEGFKADKRNFREFRERMDKFCDDALEAIGKRQQETPH